MKSKKMKMEQCQQLKKTVLKMSLFGLAASVLQLVSVNAFADMPMTYFHANTSSENGQRYCYATDAQNTVIYNEPPSANECCDFGGPDMFMTYFHINVSSENGSTNCYATDAQNTVIYTERPSPNSCCGL